MQRNGPQEPDYRQFTQDPFSGRPTTDTAPLVSDSLHFHSLSL